MLALTWKDKLEDEFEKEYYKKLVYFLREDVKNFTLFPPKIERFNAYNTTPFESVKVVILGQDPYHGFAQAHGLSFSIQGDQAWTTLVIR